jgi:hypothetical protein
LKQRNGGKKRKSRRRRARCGSCFEVLLRSEEGRASAGGAGADGGAGGEAKVLEEGEEGGEVGGAEGGGGGKHAARMGTRQRSTLRVMHAQTRMGTAPETTASAVWAEADAPRSMITVV